VSDVAGIASSALTSSTDTTSTNGIASMDAEDFFQILIAQLQQQDPMNPMSNEAMVQQMATIRDMEMSYTLTEALQQMTGEQRFAGAAGLIGHYVQGVVEDSEGTQIALEGVVTGVRFTGSGKAILELDTGESLPLENLTQVYAVVSDSEEVAEEDGDAAALASKAIRQSRTRSAAGGTPQLGTLGTFGLQNADGLNIGVTLG